MAKKKKGFLYKAGGTIILCTGKGKKDCYETFAGVVVEDAGEFWGLCGGHSHCVDHDKCI